MSANQRRKLFTFCSCLLLLGASGSDWGRSNPKSLPECIGKSNLAIRFYYRPSTEDHIVTPLIFRQVSENDPVFGTWSNDYPTGVTTYISPGEMRRLGEALAKLGLEWQDSPKPLSFEIPRDPISPWRVPPPRGGGMEIDITCDTGSAVASLPQERVCRSMKELDPVFSTPMAIYNFRGYRLDWGCKVPNFDLGKRPDSPKREFLPGSAGSAAYETNH